MRQRGRRWQTCLGQWVLGYGVSATVRDLKTLGVPITNDSVYKWIRGVTAPRAEHARALVRLSGGRLSLDAIYDHREVVGVGDDA